MAASDSIIVNPQPIPEIELRNVDITFGNRPHDAVAMAAQGASREEILAATDTVIGVHNASLIVNKAEICVLMGLSGSGKSTLLRAVNGLNSVVNGEVLLHCNGECKDVAKIGLHELREIRMRWVSMVFQQFALLPWRTVAENVAFGLEIRGLPKSERTAIINEKLEMVGLIDWRDKYAHELSGGMQQRVGLARAFATDADILLMDEPFSALDPLIRSRMQDELLELQSKLNKTVLFVSHDLDEAIKLGSSIAIMESGRIVQFGSPEEIVLNPIDQYVADFVAHMNPVGVLRAKSIMRPVEDSKTTDVIYHVNGQPLKFSQSKTDRSIHASFDSTPLEIIHWEYGQTVRPEKIHCASLDTSLKNVIEIRHLSKLPVILLNEEQLVCGIVGDNEIYSAILHKTEKSTTDES